MKANMTFSGMKFHFRAKGCNKNYYFWQSSPDPNPRCLKWIRIWIRSNVMDPNDHGLETLVLSDVRFCQNKPTFHYIHVFDYTLQCIKPEVFSFAWNLFQVNLLC